MDEWRPNEKLRSNLQERMSFFMPNGLTTWNFSRMDGNPAKILEASELIKQVEKKGKITKSAAIDISYEIRDSNLTITWQFGLLSKNFRRVAVFPPWRVENRGDHNKQ